MRGPLPGEGWRDCACGDVGSSDSPGQPSSPSGDQRRDRIAVSSMLSWMLLTASNGVSAKRCMIIFASRFLAPLSR